MRHALATMLMALALLPCASPLQAQDRPAVDAPAAQDKPALPGVDELRRQLDAIPRKLAEDDDGRKLLDETAAIGTAADQVAARRSQELADIDSRLAGLGPAPEKGAPPMPPTWPSSAPAWPGSAAPWIPNSSWPAWYRWTRTSAATS